MAEVITFDPLDAVVHAQFSIEEGVVGGEELRWRQVLVENVTEQRLGLAAHGDVQVAAVVGAELS